ncbi:AAA family ATPase [Candidatus Sumerlaeota bacterium]|nr:AAA family ATPase [Candidatus Sumerlaeota bacterium]
MRGPKREMRECPWCGEEIRAQAVICRFCKNDVTPRGIEAAKRFVEDKEPGEAARLARTTGPATVPMGAPMPQTLLDRILAVGEEIDEGERRPIAVLFSDLCAFTTLTDEIGPERMNDLLDRVYAEVQAIVSYYGGIVEKFMGDAVMAIFGAVQAHGDDTERAIRAALDIREAIRRIGSEENMALDAHAGVAFGEVAFTIRGHHGRIDYRSIGDAVNLASRLQHEAGDGETVVDERTYRQTRTIFDWKKLPPLEIKGKAKPVVAYRVVGIRTRFSHARLGDRIALAPMVGRQAELDILNLTARRVAKGQGRVVLIEGEAGVGKSRLIYEFEKGLPPGKWHCFTGRCLSYGENTPFFPFLELLRSILLPPGAEEERIRLDRLSQRVEEIFRPAVERARSTASRKEVLRRRDLATLSLRTLFSIEPQGNALLALSPSERRKAVFWSIADLLKRLAEERPTTVVLEDFQWSDDDSRDLLAFLIEQMETSPVLVVVVARPHPSPAEVPVKKDVVRISLKELSEENGKILLHEILGIERIPSSLRDPILGRTDGNPFYMEEIVLDLEDQGVLERHGTAYRLLRPVDAVEIPDTVEGVVLARIDRLERKVKSVLQCASVIGQEFQHQILRQVTEVGRRLREHLESLIKGDYILRQTLIPEMVYIFRHIVLRDVAYGTMLEKRRREYHARVAEAIEILFPDNLDEYVELLAHHAERGESMDKAIRYLERAAAKSESLYSNRAAADFWERMLGCLDRAEQETGLPESSREEFSRRRLAALLRVGELCRKIGRAARGISAYEAAQSQAAALADARLQSQALQGLAEAHRYAGDMDRAIEALEQADASARQSGDDAQVASCHNMRSHFERVRGNFAEAGRYAEKVLEYAQGAGNRVLQFQALNHLGVARMYDGRLDDSEAHFDQARELADELARKSEWVQIEINRGIVSMKRGDSAEARRRYSRAVSEAKKIEFERGGQLALLGLGDLFLKTGDFKRAVDASRQLLKRSEKARFSDILAVAQGNLARALIAQGEFEPARKALGESEKIARADGNYVGLIDALSVRVEYLLARGDKRRALDQARDVLEQVTRREETEHLSGAQLLMARAQLENGRVDEALESARAAEESAIRGEATRDRAWALWCVGVCRRRRKEPGPARECLARALDLGRRVGDKELERAVRVASRGMGRDS